MWGSLARGITASVKETASTAAASVAPHAGDVLRRVGEVVAPALEEYDDDDEDYEDEDYEDDESYEDDDDDEDAVDFEGDSEEEDEGEVGSPDLDRYRNKNTATAAAAVGVMTGGGDHATNNNDNAATAAGPASANSLIFSEHKNDAAPHSAPALQSNINAEKEALVLKQKEEEAELARIHAEMVERERLAAVAAKQAEEKKERERLAAAEDEARILRAQAEAAKKAELEMLEHERRVERKRILEEERLEKAQFEAAKKAELERLGNERIEQERILEEERLQKAAHQEKMLKKAEMERLENERLEQERILEEERLQKVAAAAEAAEKERQEEEASAAERRRLEQEEAASLAQAKAEAREKERLAAAAAAEEEEAKRAELDRLEKERAERQRALAEKRQREEESRRRHEEERLAAEALEIQERERIEHERQVEAERLKVVSAQKKAEADRMKKERLEAEQQTELARLEEERIEGERQMEEQRMQEEEMTRQKVRQEEEEADAKAAMSAELGLENEKIKRLEQERVAAEEEIAHAHEEGEGAKAMAAAAVNEAKLLAREIQQQQMQLEKLNTEARDAAEQLAQLQRDQIALQTSNEEYEIVCGQLKSDLHRAAETISTLRESAADNEEEERLRWEQEAKRAEEEESSILAAAKLEMEQQIAYLRQSMEGQIKSLEAELIEERKLSVDQQHGLQSRLEEATERLSQSENERKEMMKKRDGKVSKQLQVSEKAAAKAVALLDKKDEEVEQLKQVIADMRGAMKKNKLEEEEAEEEMDELHHENEELHQKLEKLQKENKEMKTKLDCMSDDSEKLGGLKMELQLLEEERLREKSALESGLSKTTEDHALVLSERDDAKSQANNLEQLLAAARADLELANTDRTRAQTANENLQRALEDFQSERDAEIALLGEQRMTAEDATEAAFNARVEAMKEVNAAEMRDVQYACDKSLQNSIEEMDRMEATIQECRRDNMNLRKALDEAIARLQTNQEDVIDRSLIKNVILDWHSKKGKAKRDVMVLLGSILHFTEDDKDKAFIGEGPGTLDKVYGAVAAPLPPAKLNVDKIEGDTVREKWVNFLLAETGEEEVTT